VDLGSSKVKATTAAEAAFFIGTIHAELKRRSSTGLHGSVQASRKNQDQGQRQRTGVSASHEQGDWGRTPLDERCGCKVGNLSTAHGDSLRSSSCFAQDDRDLGSSKVKATTRAEAAFFICTIHAALKRRSSTGSHGSVRAPAKIKIKVKGSGQECPLHICLKIV
jgi:hypothetical protein